MTPRFSSLSSVEQSALFELLVVAQLADGNIRLSEQEQSLALLDSMGFASEYARDFYVNAIHGRVAGLAGAPEARRERLADLCARFDSREKRLLVANTVEGVLAADHATAPAEGALSADLRDLLKV